MRSRLLSIELQGYKTFANRFRFDFPGEITCVVGPNGSGKSNIADSIRWVLGEQSFNLLRARKTEDLIFSGSSNRSRAGMASVSIVFNNEDGWFPLDFSEVSITRRAYRDGQNEYLLNNQKVRLKDVVELLAQSGVTPRTYTIIGQGLVDAALSLRPDERRQFFEEAAGISLHRRRKEEALTRLDNTRRNLDRVLDILSELKPRLSSLEKQAKRAIEQERIKADLQILLKEWYGYHWHRAQDDYHHSKEVLRSQEERLEKIKKQKERIDSSINDLRSQLHQNRNELSVWHADSSSLHRELEAVNRSIAVADERLRSQQEQIAFLSTDLARLQEEVDAVHYRYEVDLKELSAVQNEKDDLSRLLNETEQNYQVLQSKRNELEKEKQKADAEYNRLEAEKVKLTIFIEEMSAQGKNLEEMKAKLILVKTEIKNKLDSIQKEADTFSKKVMDQQVELQGFETRLKGVVDEIKDIQHILNELEHKNNTLENNKAKKTAQKGIYEGSIQSNEHLGVNAQDFLKSLSPDLKKGSIESILNSFTVERGYEKAIAAGLGDYLDGFLLSVDADLDRLLHFVKSKEIGRVVLFNQANLAEIDFSESEVQIREALGTGLDFVHFKPGFSSLVIESLLKDILVVPDHVTALRVLPHIPRYQCVVTLTGEVFRGDQAIISGETKRDRFFVVQHQIEELADEIDKLEKQTEAVVSEIQFAKTELNEKIKLRQELEQKTSISKRSLEEQQKNRNKLELQSAQLQEQNRYSENQLANIEKQILETKNKYSQGKQSLLALEEKSKKAYQELQNRSRDLRSLSEDELKMEIGHWRTKLAVVEQSIQEKEHRLSADKNREEQLKHQKSTLESRNASIRAEIETLSQQQEESSNRSITLNEKLENLSRRIQPAEQSANEIEGQIRKKNDEQNNLQQRLTSSERYLTQAQLELSRRNDELEKLREKIEDDFGIVHFEYKTEIIGPTPLPLNGMVNELPMIEKISPEVEDTIRRQKAQLRRIGPINPDAKDEYESVKERYENLNSQLADLERADADLRKIVQELDALMKNEFQATFKLVANEFRNMFNRLFGGGVARLVLLDEENPTEGGIEIEAQLPGKRKQGLAVLSGGERSLTAVALIFSLLKVSPTPFCVLDEVDAALDEANVGRFGDLLRELSGETQFIVITHNRNTVQLADVIYGVTMARDSSSQVISLKMDEVGEALVS